MKRIEKAAVALTLYAMLAWAAPAGAEDKWKIDNLSVEPAGEVPDMSKLVVKCSYSRVLVGKKHQVARLKISDNGIVKDSTDVSACPNCTREVSYNINGGGPHSIECAVFTMTGPTGMYNHGMGILVTVTSKTPAPGGAWPQSPDEKEVACLATVPVWLEMDAPGVQGAQQAAKVTAVKEKQKIQFPVTHSKAVFKTSVQCGYVMEQVSVNYSFECKNGRPAGKPHHYFCKK